MSRTLEQIIQDTKEEWKREVEKQHKQLSDIEDDLNQSMDKYGITINDTSSDCRIQSDSSGNGRREPTQQQDQRPSVHRAGTGHPNRELATEAEG